MLAIKNSPSRRALARLCRRLLRSVCTGCHLTFNPQRSEISMLSREFESLRSKRICYMYKQLSLPMNRRSNQLHTAGFGELKQDVQI